jgi:hypothetical protein
VHQLQGRQSTIRWVGQDDAGEVPRVFSNANRTGPIVCGETVIWQFLAVPPDPTHRAISALWASKASVQLWLNKCRSALCRPHSANVWSRTAPPLSFPSLLTSLQLVQPWRTPDSTPANPPGARARESCKVDCVGRELVLSGLGRLGFESGYGIPTPLMSRTLALPSSPLVHYDLNLPRPPRGSPHAS